MNGRLIQNGAALAIGALLAVFIAISVELTVRFHDQAALFQLIERARPEFSKALQKIDAAGEATLSALEQGALPESAAKNLFALGGASEDRDGGAESGDAGGFELRTRVFAELLGRDGAYRLRRSYAWKSTSVAAAEAADAAAEAAAMRGAAAELAERLSSQKGALRHVSVFGAGDASVWVVWRSRGASYPESLAVAALVEIRPRLDVLNVDKSVYGATFSGLSVIPDARQAAASGPRARRMTARFGDKSIAIDFSARPRKLVSTLLIEAAPSLIVALLIAIAVAALLRSQRARLALFDVRQRDILANIAAKQRQLEASDERFRHLAESTNVVPWTADLDRQRFTYVGPQIEALSGYPASTWQASGFWLQHIHPGDRQRIIGETLRTAEEGRYVTVEYRIRSADGRTLHIRNMLTVSRTTEGEGEPTRTTAQGFLLDVSEMKSAANALELAREKAEEANRVKSEFLASMSHELRTPLNAVIGFSEIMKDQVFGPLDPRYREYAESVHSSGKHLLDLINDILDLSKIEAGRIELAEEPTDLAGLMEDCRILLHERMKSAGVREEIDISGDMPLVVVDERRIKQVLLNLLSNAVKFTPPGGKITMTARWTPGRGALLAVRDTGIGMSADEIPKALSKFGQIDGELNRRHDGTGLGLPIAKSLVELHGGGLEIQSEKGRGTEIRVWLPENRAARAA